MGSCTCSKWVAYNKVHFVKKKKVSLIRQDGYSFLVLGVRWLSSLVDVIHNHTSGKISNYVTLFIQV